MRLSSLPRLPPRERDSHKGTYGRVLVVAGSPEMPGAAVLSARAALRGGAGLVTVAVPEAIAGILGTAVPEATQVHLPTGASRRALARALAPALESSQAVAVGPGLGTGPRARALIEVVLARSRCPVVIDADALNALAGARSLRPARPEACVWTPHPGEFRRLTGERPAGDAERIDAAGRFARKRGGVVVLKGHRTVIHDGRDHRVNATGNPGMATGGAGDVLTGVIAALLAQGLRTFEAATLGASVHGLAGDLAAEDLGEVSVVAGDIIERLPGAFLAHAAPRRTRRPPGDRRKRPGDRERRP